MTLLERTMKFSREDICYAGAAVLQLALRGYFIVLDSTPDQRPAALRRDLSAPDNPAGKMRVPPRSLFRLMCGAGRKG